MNIRANCIVAFLCTLFFVGVCERAVAASVNESLSAALDTDGDGLSDLQEQRFGTDPLRVDTDEDGYPDGLEVRSGYSPTSTSRERLAKRIRIQLKSQTMEQELGGVVFATHRISTGRRGMRTPTGTFHILSKNPRKWSTRAKLWMPWWMAFTPRGHGIHELPEWPSGKKEGAKSLGTPVSGGCVRVGIDAAHALYNWTPVGTEVRVFH